MINQIIITDKSKSSNYQVALNDITGVYSKDNPGGYGGDNGNPVSKFYKYVFELIDLVSGKKYTQVNSDDLSNPDEIHNPSVGRIANRETVFLNAGNFGLKNFDDSIYKINMYVVIDEVYDGEGYKDTNVVVNVSGLRTLVDNYQAIYSEGFIYGFKKGNYSSLILDQNIKESFINFLPVLKTSTVFILSDGLTDCLNKKIANMASNCDCDNSEDIDKISEIQIYLWGMQLAIDKEDYMQASQYLLLARNLCKSINCNC